MHRSKLKYYIKIYYIIIHYFLQLVVRFVVSWAFVKAKSVFVLSCVLNQIWNVSINKTEWTPTERNDTARKITFLTLEKNIIESTGLGCGSVVEWLKVTLTVTIGIAFRLELDLVESPLETTSQRKHLFRFLLFSHLLLKHNRRERRKKGIMRREMQDVKYYVCV